MQGLNQNVLTWTLIWVLVKPLAEAVMYKVPSLPLPSTAVRTSEEKVASAVLLENQVATVLISCPPLQVAVNSWLGLSSVREAVEGVTMGALVQATETMMGWVPLIVGSIFEVAVTVPEPAFVAVTRPPAVIVAMLL